ncbi:DNA alkylation repair protein [Paraflavisolibacter sp. H34]|uniref:DNA alkylation repair protein n=1 Tax=Huijunlia imazamoxiresistens TaxID=3127457 RepID=UPI0030185798
MTATEIIDDLRLQANPRNKEGMGRFGINTETVLGISIPTLRRYAKAIGTDHGLAQELWKTNVHEGRLLAVFIADAKKVDEALMERWVADFNSWDICDQCCSLFDRTPEAFRKAMEWSGRPEEFVKRAGFSMMATLAVHRKKAPDEDFLPFFARIEQEAGDERNFVKKSVNWALRQMGKRSPFLNEKACALARQLQLQPGRSARWIAADALRELTSEKQLERLAKRR